MDKKERQQAGRGSAEKRNARLFEALTKIYSVSGQIRVQEVRDHLGSEISDQQFFDDLKFLEKCGLILRPKRGIVEKLKQQSQEFFRNTIYDHRVEVRQKEKNVVARRLIGDGHLEGGRVLITTGTSCTAVFEAFKSFELEDRGKLPHDIVTNNLPGLVFLLQCFPEIPVTVVGGNLVRTAAGTDGSGSWFDVKNKAELYTAIVSVSTIDPDSGLYCSDGLSQLRTKILKICSALIIPADHSKLIGGLAGGVRVGTGTGHKMSREDWGQTWLYVDLWKEAFRPTADKKAILSALQDVRDEKKHAEQAFSDLANKSVENESFVIDKYKSYVSELINFKKLLKDRLVLVDLEEEGVAEST